MGVKCLGAVTIETFALAKLQAMAFAAKYGEQIKQTPAMEYLKLEKKRYIPMTEKGEIDQSENRCEILLEHSKKEPQPVGEILGHMLVSTDTSVNLDMMNRLWVYDGKLYQATRNDYNQKQIRLLILDFLDKERRKFRNLEKKFKNKEA